MKQIILLLFSLLMTNISYAQVGINTNNPHASSALDIVSPGNNQGVLLPRMTTLQKEAIVNPASGLLVYDTNKNCLSQNVGTESVPVWLCLAQTQTQFFYMPSIAVDAKTISTVNPPLDLYDEYKKQFSRPMSKSTGAPVAIPYFPSADQLHYYITYYDDSVLKINAISNDGKVSYEVIKAADYNSFMNVVFVIK